jgi:hypothetical protein
MHYFSLRINTPPLQLLLLCNGIGSIEQQMLSKSAMNII